MGGVTLGIPGIIGEFHVGLNQVINGLISWIVLTLGVGVLLIPISAFTNPRRTSSGLLRRFTSASDLCSFSSPSLLSRVQFGVLRLKLGEAFELVELLVLLRSPPVKVCPLPLNQTFSSFMNEAGGWVFI
jgi:hypothetical protein